MISDTPKKEFWVNIYKDFNGGVVTGYYWKTKNECLRQSFLGERKLLYRIHVRLK